MERDAEVNRRLGVPAISTHTLTWSVTLLLIAEPSFAMISTHTLTWSVTSRDHIVKELSGISTHTLTWSVT